MMRQVLRNVSVYARLSPILAHPVQRKGLAPTVASISNRFSTLKHAPAKGQCVVPINTSDPLPLEDDTMQLTGFGRVPTTQTMNFIDTAENEAWPVYRILGREGALLEGCSAPAHLGKEELVKMYKSMVRIQALDDIFYNAQRQGRISFYMQNAGEEATHVGSASALTVDDTVFAQYREVGVLLWRGFTLQQAADQCFSNEKDLGKGRQMPVHYGSRELNYQTISSPLATQLPQAVGAAYALKLEKKKACTICYFGEGAASEGDFHAALNFAATVEAPVVFFCRNNGYAISTPVKDQFRGDGIISRAAGYGMKAIRVDGNDLFAVHNATLEAKRIAIEEGRPVLIEAMSYRRGHHSTSDDSTRYRSQAEITHWQTHLDPVKRVRTYLESKGWWDDAQEAAIRDAERAAVLNALEVAEKRPKPSVSELFSDVYKTMTPNLMRQEKELKAHIDLYPDYYNAGHGH
jgi:2-oxoisovalerate dehydrogenase E1 component alpha subunit